MATIRFALDSLKVWFYNIEIHFKKSEKEAYEKVKDICFKYDIALPEELIMNVKYFARTYSDEGPNLKHLINTSKSPHLQLRDIIKKIGKISEKEAYLERLINQLPKAPAPGAGNVTGLTLYSDFKSHSIKELRDCRNNQNNEKTNSELNQAMIKKAIQLTCSKKNKNCSIALERYVDIKNEYPQLEPIKIYKGNDNFEGLEDLVPQSTFYHWLKDYKKNISEIKEIKSL